ncbi:MAG: sigma-70 family RNA polymerase sigma factor [Oscillospiraceae bacterium]|nr:sigma-70 family RNA polymerase sigma factor [Oscillospiraceae bacterium]MCL2279524.1 sigma-70 family RNA polymerase sigma factor [Oscillospiraceae bacterium]
MDKQRYVLLNGEKVYVTEEVYRAFYRPEWRESKQRKLRIEMECSLDSLLADGFEAVAEDTPIDEGCIRKMLLAELCTALAGLTTEERALLSKYYYEQKSEREAAKEFGIPRNTLIYRRDKVIVKLRKLMKVE